LTVSVKYRKTSMSGDFHDAGDEIVGHDKDSEYVTVRTYDEGEHDGYIGVPRQFGLNLYEAGAYEDQTVWGNHNKGWFPQTIKPRTPEQADFMQELANVCKTEGPVDAVVNARTGSGKTVSSLKTIADCGRPALVIVPTNKLKRQWYGNRDKKHGALYFWGEEWAEKHIGIVQQGVCDYKGKRLVIALAPSLSRRDYGTDFYNYFSVIIFDELHRYASPELARVFMQFPARVRIAMTATNRDDALKKVIHLHMGKPRVVSKQEVAIPRVKIFKYRHCGYIGRPDNEGMVINGLVKLKSRNQLLVNIIHKLCWEKGKNTVVLSDRVAHLMNINQMLVDAGVPSSEIGLHVAAYPSGKYRATARTDKGGIIRIGNDFDSQYKAKAAAQTFANLFSARDESVLERSGYDPRWVEKYKDHSIAETKVSEVVIKQTDEELERILRDCSVKLVTYGIFAEGVDDSSINAGVEASPRRKLTQAVGRVLRHDDPVWYGIDDNITFKRDGWDGEIEYSMFNDFAVGRKKSYEAQKAIITYAPKVYS